MVKLERGDFRIPFITKGIRQRLSANAIQRSLMGTPYAVRRTDLLATIRDLKQKEKRAGAIRYVRKTYKPSKVHFGKSPTWMDFEYEYEGKAYGYNAKTGRRERRYAKRGRDEIVCLKDIEDEIKEDLEEEYFEDVTVVIDRGWRLK